MLVLGGGVVAGGVLALVLQAVTAPGETGAAAEAGPWPPSTSSVATTSAVTMSAAPLVTADVVGEQVLLAWTPGGLRDGFADAVRRLPSVGAVTSVAGGLVELAGSAASDGQPSDVLHDGWVIPLDAMAYDPATYPDFVPTAAAGLFRDLGPGEGLLSEGSAALRGLGAGATLRLVDGTALRVAAVVDDALVGAAEVAVAAPDLPALPQRYLLLRSAVSRPAMEVALRATLPAGVPLRVRGPGETPYLRHGDAVLPQLEIKRRFGEFAYRRGPAREFEQDPGWARANLVTAAVPLLGDVTCHRAVIDPLRQALSELEAASLGWLVDPQGYAGCAVARFTDDRSSVSRHAWGLALDLNQRTNPMGTAGDQDPRLVEAFAQHGFTWGGSWLVPDPAHLEYALP